MNVYWYSIQWGFKPRLNKVKASGGCHRFSEEIYRAELDKIWAQIRQVMYCYLHYIGLLAYNCQTTRIYYEMVMNMACRTKKELKELVKEARKCIAHGKVADYIPALGKANPKDLAIAIQYPDGKCISAGDIERKITLQSISR